MVRQGSESRALVPQRTNEGALVLYDSVSQQRSGVNIRELLRILRRHLRIVVATPLILLAATLVFINAVEPVYTATATVLIDPRRATIVDPNNTPVLTNFSSDDATTESQVMLIQSIAVLQRVVEKLNLTADPNFSPQPGLLDPIKRLFSSSKPIPGASEADIAKAQSVELLQKRLKVVRQRSTFLADINVGAWDPATAAKVANAIAEAYFHRTSPFQVRVDEDRRRLA
jgi:uncharacterized protein involved in exopolysaccharide biosynthesis